MDRQLEGEDIKRVMRINRMIIEMASGNFNFRIPSSSHNDELETITMLLNMMAEELQESYKSLYLIHTRQSQEHVADIVFVLDSDLKIKHFSSSTHEFPLLNSKTIIGTDFVKCLDKKSRTLWNSQMIDPLNYPPKINLQLKVAQKLSLPVSFFLNQLEFTKSNVYLMLTGVRTVNILKQNEKNLNSIARIKNGEGIPKQAKSVLKREVDVRIMKEIHNYIQSHLDQSLISLRDLAHTFGTNEYKLKKGFKELYGTTVYKFQMEERLKKAVLLLESTKIQIKVISKLVGFSDVAHFSRSFKKRYGYSPSQLRK
ncbi:helix-turn-helix domain-containing protein [Leeuwenhoekiella sp. MAR_2009_132]|uniref:helix-turn-helix domain-containing protein n=1 Tax=Leeuwenhoekiella sp. MAR_2009_132 TaxID=1392489 RepID=UPI00048D5E2D|nr:helix-turn-helix domain-containing protein [Leeuwenhoekiella sp. MAR_2009_132]